MSILLVQLVYKSAWLAVVAFPALIAETRTPGLMLFAAAFTVSGLEHSSSSPLGVGDVIQRTTASVSCTSLNDSVAHGAG